MKNHYCRCREELWNDDDPPGEDVLVDLRQQIEPWLASLIQSEHFCLLLGSGLTTGVAHALGTTAPGMPFEDLGTSLDENLRVAASNAATSTGRGAPNLEDLLASARALSDGLSILADDRADEVRNAYYARLKKLLVDVLAAERSLANKLAGGHSGDTTGLYSLLLSAASRPPSQDRLEIFTTNYDRLIEHACDQLGLRLVDRFIGSLTPRFRSSRLSVDMHYDPPGIRGEPRYLEGVVRHTKLHGSLDWRNRDGHVCRVALPFGADDSHPEAVLQAHDDSDGLLIFPNPAKDVETTGYPYADLHRDFSASLCRPNTVAMTYGYGFGDEHLNRVIRDMLTLSSTHLVVVSFDDPGADADKLGRIGEFINSVGSPDQVTVLLGSHFGSLPVFASQYMPRSLSESLRRRESRIRVARGERQASESAEPPLGDSDANAT